MQIGATDFTKRAVYNEIISQSYVIKHRGHVRTTTRTTMSVHWIWAEGPLRRKGANLLNPSTPKLKKYILPTS